MKFDTDGNSYAFTELSVLLSSHSLWYLLMEQVLFVGIFLLEVE